MRDLGHGLLEAQRGKKKAWGPVPGNPGCRDTRLTFPYKLAFAV